MKELLKKNILSIICGVVAILAIVASFVPLGGYLESLQSQLNQSKSNYSSLETLLSSPRQKPIVNPDTAAAEPLGTFPNEAVIKEGKKTVEKVEQESQRMREAAVKLNQHQLLVPGSLPTPMAGPDIRFRETYTRLFAYNAETGIPPIAKELNGTIPPNDAQIRIRLAQEEDKIRNERTIKLPNGSVANQAELQQLTAEMSAKLPEQMRRDVANSHPIYVEPNAFEVNTKIMNLPPGTRPDPVDIWWSQVQLWVQQDVINAITQMNKGKATVMDAPVKHLFSIKVPPNFIAAPGAQPQPGQAAADPMGGNPDAAVPQMTQVSLSGRVSNALFDVIYFDLVVDVEVPQVATFLRTLEQNRLIGVREVNLASVDSAAELAKGYYYGKTPVARLTLKCESMLMRKWTVPFMPPLIKQSMGIQDQPAAGAATPTAMAQ